MSQSSLRTKCSPGFTYTDLLSYLVLFSQYMVVCFTNIQVGILCGTQNFTFADDLPSFQHILPPLSVHLLLLGTKTKNFFKIHTLHQYMVQKCSLLGTQFSYNWNTATILHLYVVHGYFCAVIAELSFGNKCL